MNWIKKLDNIKFLKVYDVLRDIEEEANISPNQIEIPLFNDLIKFRVLLPVDSVASRNRYCDGRWKAVALLSRNKVVKSFNLIDAGITWDNRIRITIEEKELHKAMIMMEGDYNRRFQSSGDKEGQHMTWDILHPTIVGVSKSRYEAGQFADSVEAALKEINVTIKHIVKGKVDKGLDGAKLMYKVFSVEEPLITLDDLSTESGENIQEGYMHIFAGAMKGIRNPKAHANITIDEPRAIHLLFLASLLMYKLDERISPPTTPSE